MKAIPFFDATRQIASLEPAITEALQGVLSSGKFLLGEKTKAFEKSFAEYIGGAHGIAVNSGTDALKIALRAFGIGAGDEVITVSNTAVPTVSALRELGAMPIFVDSDEYGTMDVSLLEKAITTKTRAIIPVHLYGQMCDIEAVMSVAKKHNLKVIEDCAQSTGATFKGKMAGSFGHAACFSFYPTKNLGACGDGGMIVASDEKTAGICRQLRMYGMRETYCAEIEGYNSRMDEFQAAILSVKLPHMASWNARRQEIAKQYMEGVTNPKIILPKVREGAVHVFHLFVARTTERDALKKHLEKNGVGSGIHYPFPIHLQPAYSFLGHKEGSLPETEKAADEILSLPIFPELTDEEVRTVISALNSF